MAADTPPPAPPAIEVVEPAAIRALRDRLGAGLFEVIHFRGEWTAIVALDRWVEAHRILRDDPAIAMTLFIDLCGIHWMDLEYEYEVVTHLHSFVLNERIRLKTRVGSDAVAPTLCGLYDGANWQEREAWDLVGIRFEGHPDLRRILMPEDYDAHPLRRDFPVKGY